MIARLMLILMFQINYWLGYCLYIKTPSRLFLLMNEVEDQFLLEQIIINLADNNQAKVMNSYHVMNIDLIQTMSSNKMFYSLQVNIGLRNHCLFL